jgi:hypothetical protein
VSSAPTRVYAPLLSTPNTHLRLIDVGNHIINFLARPPLPGVSRIESIFFVAEPEASCPRRLFRTESVQNYLFFLYTE